MVNKFKKCSGKCKKILPIDSFYKCRSGRDGRDSRCKECAKNWQKETHSRNRGIFLNGARRNHVKKTYNITQEDYLRKSEKQNHVCMICGLPETCVTHGTLSHLCIDHDHSCCPGNKSCGNCVRDLICRRCNAILGRVNDDIELLEKVIQYLRRHASGRDNSDSGNSLGANPVKPSIVSCGNSG
jgi:Recombination endonuclease VII